MCGAKVLQYTKILFMKRMLQLLNLCLPTYDLALRTNLKQFNLLSKIMQNRKKKKKKISLELNCKQVIVT